MEPQRRPRATLSALFLALVTLLVASPQPAHSLTASQELIMFWRTNTTFESVANSAYTVIFISFAYIPDYSMFSIDLPAQCTESSSTLGLPPANLRFSCKDGIALLRAKGKKVGLSIGGGDSVTKKVPRVFTNLYNLYNAVPGGNMTVITTWTKMVGDFMAKWNMDALDFDNEEAHTAATGGTADPSEDFEALADKGGLDFMGILQIAMRQVLGPSKIFSVSLQPPFYGAPTIEDPGQFTPIKFPVRPSAPWYNNYMYLFETDKAAYDSLTYIIWMYYPKENMWEWVSNNDTLTRPILKYTLPPNLLNSTVNLVEIYRSQIQYVMKAGQVGRLDPKKMVIMTQVNEPGDSKAFIAAAEFYRQMSTLTAAERPAGYGAWTESATWSPAGCAFHTVACQLMGVCATGYTAPCPPSALNAVPAFDPPPTPVVPVQSFPAGTVAGSTTGTTGTTGAKSSAWRGDAGVALSALAAVAIVALAL